MNSQRRPFRRHVWDPMEDSAARRKKIAENASSRRETDCAKSRKSPTTPMIRPMRNGCERLMSFGRIGQFSREVTSTTAQVPWPYFARAAAVARRDVACGGLRPLDDCVPDANGTTTGSRPRPTRVPPTGGPEERVLREQSSVALFSPTRTLCSTRNVRAKRERAVWWCHPTQPRVSYSSRPHCPLAALISSSIVHLVARTSATLVRGTSGGVFDR
jgi:hypothetical protein